MEVDWNTTNTTNTSLFNGTSSDWDTEPHWKEVLHLVQQIVMTSLLVLILLAMGCNMYLKQVWEHLKRPFGLAIGIVGQFVLLPLLAFGAATALSFERDHAIGLLFLCTCPGGSTSNVFTYWVHGDVSLSVSMTTVSTVVSFGMMPFNLWLYSRWWAVGGAKIPYVKIVITLVTILVSVAVGMLIRWKSKKAAKLVSMVGTVSGLVGVLTSIVIIVVLFPFAFRNSWRLLFVGCVLPVVAFLVSYSVAFLCRRKPSICRTIGIETSIQNIPMVTSIITLSFTPKQAARMLTPVFLYAAIVIAEACVFCGLYRLIHGKGRNYEVSPQARVEAGDKPPGIYVVKVTGREATNVSQKSNII